MGERSLVTQGGRGREEEGIEDRSGRLGGGGYLRTLVSSSSSSQILHNCACKEESCTATYLEIRDTSELLTLGTQSQPQKFASVLAASIIETRQQRADRLQREAMDPVTKADLKDLFKELRAEWKEDIKSSVAAEFESWRPKIDSQIGNLQEAVGLLQK